MKFNFEKVNKNVKRTVVGAGIIATSLQSFGDKEQVQNSVETKSIGTEKNILNQPESIDNAKLLRETEEKNKIKEIEKELGISKENNDPEFYRNDYLKYMQHPSYKERLAKEMYGDSNIDNEKQKNIDNEYKNRLKIINEVPITMIPDTDSHYKDPSHSQVKDGETLVVTSPRAAPHELTQTLDHDYRPELSDKARNDEGFGKKRKEYLNDYLYDISSNIIKIENKKNEALRNIDISKENENDVKNRYDRILDKLKNIQNYYGTSPEIKARINFLRIKAMKEYGYNLNDDFDINKFEDLKKDPQYEELIDQLKLNNDQINELMKYTADNTEDKKGDYYHPGWNYDNPENNNA